MRNSFKKTNENVIQNKLFEVKLACKRFTMTRHCYLRLEDQENFLYLFFYVYEKFVTSLMICDTFGTIWNIALLYSKRHYYKMNIGPFNDVHIYEMTWSMTINFFRHVPSGTVCTIKHRVKWKECTPSDCLLVSNFS